ncbi:MAG: NUDIX domain-containing protein [Devosiaceae bacterium]|nr:NUDIX domain-containing protein [Devosiaceae bacterium]
MTKWQIFRAKLFLFIVGLFRWMTLGARAVLIRGDEVLLIRHTYVKGWQFPGGGVEKGDTFETTMRREVLEETGFSPKGDVELHGVFLNSQISGRDHVALFVVRDFDLEHDFVANREIAEIGWFKVNDLPLDITRSARARVDELFFKVEKSAYW